MTVHEALCELKVADKKISDAIMKGTFVTVNKKSNTKIKGVSIDDYKGVMRSDYQRVEDLIERVDAIKKALSLSNAQTRITVGGVEMSVAEAIYEFQHGMDMKRLFVQRLETSLQKAETIIDKSNGEELDIRVENYITSLYSNKDKANAADIKASEEDFRDKNTLYLVDPLDIRKRINELKDVIDTFTSNVDSALQISNATTYIEFEY